MLVISWGRSPVFSRLDSPRFQFDVPFFYFDLCLSFPPRTFYLRHLKGPTPAPSVVPLRLPRHAPWSHYSPCFFLTKRRVRGFCRRSKRDASLEDRWLPLDGAGCDRLQVDACCFEVGWFGRAGLRLVALLCHGPPSWCSDHHPLMCGLARWARRRPRWDSWNLGGGGGRPRSRRGRRPRSHRGRLVRATDLVRLPWFLCLSVSALCVLQAAALVLRSMIALVEVDVFVAPPGLALASLTLRLVEIGWRARRSRRAPSTASPSMLAMQRNDVRLPEAV